MNCSYVHFLLLKEQTSSVPYTPRNGHQVRYSGGLDPLQLEVHFRKLVFTRRATLLFAKKGPSSREAALLVPPFSLSLLSFVPWLLSDIISSILALKRATDYSEAPLKSVSQQPPFCEIGCIFVTVTQWVKILKKSHFISLGKSDQKYVSALRKANKIGGSMVPKCDIFE